MSELLPKAKQGTSARAIRIACLLVSVTLITGRNCLPKKAARQQSRNSADEQPTACPRSEIDRGLREKRPVVPLSILRTHWIKERRLCAVKAFTSHSLNALAILQGVMMQP